MQAISFRTKPCGSIKLCYVNKSRDRDYMPILDSVSEIPTPFRPNAIYFVRDGLAFNIYEVNSTGTQVIRRPFLTQNISVVGLTEGMHVYHDLNTMKLEVTFYDANGRQVKEMDFEPVNNEMIAVYLPYSDQPIEDTFTGDIYLKKRD